jgi:hypothetical protein
MLSFFEMFLIVNYAMFCDVNKAYFDLDLQTCITGILHRQLSIYTLS